MMILTIPNMKKIMMMIPMMIVMMMMMMMMMEWVGTVRKSVRVIYRYRSELLDRVPLSGGDDDGDDDDDDDDDSDDNW